MIELTEVLANALIEKSIRGLKVEVTKKQLYNYAMFVSKDLVEPVNISGGSFLNIELNEWRTFKLSQDKSTIGLAKDVTSDDLVIIYRDAVHMSTRKMKAYTSIPALISIGINLDEIGVRTK